MLYRFSTSGILFLGDAGDARIRRNCRPFYPLSRADGRDR